MLELVYIHKNSTGLTQGANFQAVERVGARRLPQRLAPADSSG